MYKFVTVEGNCGQAYDTSNCEKHANRMEQEGYSLIQVYQSSSAGRCGAKSVLIMVFKKNS